MNLPSTISVAGASLPQTYQAAQAALAQCSQVDECKDWADKAAALASYARQSEDQELERMAQRIRARAIRRAGELLKQIEPGKTGPKPELGVGDHTQLTREDAAREAGMSKHQQMQATRIANLPESDFHKQIESPKPPTLSQLASQGVKPRKPLVDLQGRDPKEYNRALHYVGEFEQAARDLANQDHDGILPTLNDQERGRLRAAIAKIDAITDKVATRV